MKQTRVALMDIDMEQIFMITSPIMFSGWLALVLSPLAAKFTIRYATYIAPGILSLAYMVLIMSFWAGTPGGFDTFENVKLLFTKDEIIMAGWLHYLAFDLFVGAWIVANARLKAIPFWLALICLPVTLMFGPIGFVLYMAIRISFKAITPHSKQLKSLHKA
jgi:hypothetical protein